ncbi:hypothetical protein OV450_1353 [Actinobacteria bacterium OV450]|nr:hypothetical protein OV450_1353 [Actinobacteria bacterium OV450]
MSCPLIANAETIRVTRVDSCGRVVCGADNSYVLDCFATLAMNVNTEDGTDVEYKAANGKVCGFKRGCPSFRGYDVELTFYGVSPEFIELTTGQSPYAGFDGALIGYDDCSIQCDSGFAIELWAQVLGEEVCPNTPTTDGAWIYFLLPWVTNGQLGDLEIGSEAVNLVLSGSTRANSRWGIGPYNVQAADVAQTPGPMLTPLGENCHRRSFITTIAPPVVTCDYQPVPLIGVCAP